MMRSLTRLFATRYAFALLALCCGACGDESSMPDDPMAMAGSGVMGGGSAAPAPMGGGAAPGNLGGSPAAGGGGAQGGAASGGIGGVSGSAAGSAAGRGGMSGGAADAGMAGMPAMIDGGPTGAQPDAGPPAGYQPCPSAGEVCKILPLGDSITFGIGYNGGYRVELFRKAHAAGKNITFTGSLSNGPNTVDGVTFPKKNEGHSGWKIAQLMPLIPSPALQDPPHIVLLMIGTNDISQNDDLANAPERLGELLDVLIEEAPEALIVVAKITPLSFGGSGVGAYNDAIPAVVEERAANGEHVILVDQFEGFPTSELGDGVHPNQKGYERMAGVWYDAIEDSLP